MPESCGNPWAGRFDVDDGKGNRDAKRSGWTTLHRFSSHLSLLFLSFSWLLSPYPVPVSTFSFTSFLFLPHQLALNWFISAPFNPSTSAPAISNLRVHRPLRCPPWLLHMLPIKDQKWQAHPRVYSRRLAFLHLPPVARHPYVSLFFSRVYQPYRKTLPSRHPH